MVLIILLFDNFEVLILVFVEDLVSILKMGICICGCVLLVVSGGRMLFVFFKQFSEINFEWDKVDIILVDECWVDEDYVDSNISLVKNNLIKNKVSVVCFVEFKSELSDVNEGVNVVEVVFVSMF